MALKVLRPQAMIQPGVRELFLREAEALKRLSHPNVVGFHDLFEHDGSLVLSIEHVEGCLLYTSLGEEFRIRVKDAHGHIPPSAMKAFERMMRQGNGAHAVDPRLVALVGIVSSHFGGKPIEVVSGYRAYTPTQYLSLIHI